MGALLRVRYDLRSSFAVAAREAGPGYDDPAFLAGVDRSPRGLATPDLASLPDFMAAAGVAVAMCKDTGRDTGGNGLLRVVDFGGAEGGHFGLMRALFPPFEMRWSVVERPDLVVFGQEVIRCPDLCFLQSLDDVRGCDLAYFSGSLQYVEDWRAVLDHPVVRDAPAIFIMRTCVADGEIPFLQTTEYEDKTVRYAGRVFDRRELFSELGRTHSLVASWRFEQTCVGSRAYAAPAMLWRKR